MYRMRLLFGLILTFLLANKAFSNHVDEEIEDPQNFTPKILNKNSTDWDCREIGPFEFVDIENANGQEERAIHLVSDERIERLRNTTPYKLSNVLMEIDSKLGDQYYGFPMICKREKEVVKFIEHPYVIKKLTDGNSYTKSATGSHRMHCEIFQLEGHNFTTNFTWVWYKKAEKGQWKELDLSNPNYLQKDNGSNNIIFNSLLKIRSLSMIDEGDYKCLGQNEYGDHEYLFELKVLGITGLIMPFAGIFVAVMLMSALVLIREKMNEKNEMIEELKRSHLEYSKTASA